MRKLPLRTGVLFGVVIGGTITLFALRTPDAASEDYSNTVARVVNEPGFWNGLFDIEPSPLASCSELREWLADHPAAFTATAKRAAFKVELRYRPAVCAACLEQPEATLADVRFEERRSWLATTDQYVMRIVSTSSSIPPPTIGDAWTSRIHQVIGGDTLPCAFLHAETMPPGVPFQSILLGFDSPQDMRDRRVIISDSDGALGGDLILALPMNGPTALAEALNPSSSFVQP